MALHNLPDEAHVGLNTWRSPAQPDLEVNHYRPDAYNDKQTVYAETHHRHPQSYAQPATEGTRSKPLSRNPCGLSPLLFGCLVALFTALVIGGALGGGLGSAIKPANRCTGSAAAASNSSAVETITITRTASACATSATPASTALYTDYVVVPPAQILSVPYDCPNPPSITTKHNDVFTFVCGVDLPGNDIAALISYSLADCCTACSGYNLQQGSTICVAFLFDANMTHAWTSSAPPGGYNCLLKDAKASQVTIENTTGLYVAGLMESSG